jgi:beta-lactamase superfamily II metal-dependent hydrolase
MFPRLHWFALCWLGVFILAASGARAQEAHYLSIVGEGTASVIIAKADKLAFITDGGHRGRRGIGGATIDGQPVLDYLIANGIEDLIITCSHPHADHMQGLIDLIENEKILKFTRVVFVDSGYEESGGKLKSLDSMFRSKWDTTFRARGKDFAAESGNTGLPQITRQSARDADAFQKINYANNLVEAATFKYKPTTTHPHGDCVITEYLLKFGGKTCRVVDFDDANSELLVRYADSIREDPSKSPPDVVVIPHHGSDLTDLAPLIDLAKAKRGGRRMQFIFTVNAANRYSHPGPMNVKACIDTVGIDNIFFTGDTGNVLITQKGIGKKSQQQRDRELAEIIDPQIRKAGAALGTTRSTSPEYQDAEKSLEILQQIRNAYLEEPDNQIAANSPLRPNTGDYDRIVKSVDRTPADVSTNNPAFPGIRFRPPEADNGGTAVAQPRGPVSPPGGASASTAGPRVTPQSSPKGTQSPIRVRNISPRFRLQFRMRPVFGGIIIGNDTSELSDVPLSCSFRSEYGVPVIEVNVRSRDGSRRTGRFSQMSTTDLYCAYHFVNPTDEMKARTDLPDNECGLLGLSRRHGDTWEFGIHPAIANTLIARDGMRVDMILARSRSARAEDWVDALANLFEKQPPRSLTKVAELQWTNYQWFDAPAVVTVTNNSVIVRAETEPFDTLMRFRLWGKTTPSWLRGDDTESILLQQECNKRLQEAAVTQKCDTSAAFQVAIARRTISVEMAREMQAKALPKWLKDAKTISDLYKAVADESGRRNDAKITELGLNLSPSVVIERLERSIQSSLDAEEEQDFEPAWLAKRGDDDERAAESREFERRLVDQAGRRPDLLKSDAYRLAILRLRARVALAAAISQDNVPEVDQMSFNDRYAQLVKAEKLDQSSDYVVPILEAQIESRLMDELEGYLECDSGKLVQSLLDEFDGVRRIERFAKTVAILNWLKRDKKLPATLPKEIVPLHVNVPPSLSIGGVLK